MHFLPGYSPELNPDEILNADLKRTVSTDTAPKSRTDVFAGVFWTRWSGLFRLRCRVCPAGWAAGG
ncbi:transposase [Saccharopolyspora phatthalungensis]|uniref:Transposase n=1 Tax=Saccharopolyspora phatthalungensis TaxID=664693 RepID=A0A840Q946_9PSEU|nr:transposase [Saccharopolyspora phatthalungensis]